jgi:Flp pilus assembly protein TadD
MAASKRWGWLLAVLLCLCPAGGGQSSSSKGQSGATVRHHRVAERTIRPEVEQAEAAIDAKNYSQAEQLLKQAVTSGPADYRAWFDLGFVYTATERRADAIAAYRKAVAAKPDVFESNLNLGISLAAAGDADAATFLRAATQLKPSAKPEEGLARAWLSLGHVLEKKQPIEALAAFRKAAALQPKNPEPHFAAGVLLEQQNDFSAAEKEYKQAAELDPRSTDALAGLVNLYTRAKRLPEAETALRQYIAANPQNPAAHTQLARVLAASGRNDEAAIELQAALKLAPQDPEALRELASTYLAAKKYADAEPIYRSVLAANPNDAEAHASLGHALLFQRRFADAQQELLTAVKRNPRLGDAYGDLALVASELQDYALTVKALDARAQLLPEVPGTYFLRATALDHLKAFPQAAQNYRQFLLASNGKNPDQEWQARHRLKAIEPKK